MTTALIDGDIVAYRSAASAEQDEADIALIRASRTLQDIVSVTGADEINLFLSGSRNFRYDLYPDYKANRKKMVRPKHLETVREFLVLKWGAKVTDGYEADDALGISSESSQSPTVICSIDKDLKQIPGVHYNFVSGQFEHVDTVGGWRTFYKQLLTGDRADNVPGIRGVGKVRSERILAGLIDPGEMYERVKFVYKDDETLLRNARLIYIWRKEDDLWNPPVGGVGEIISGGKVKNADGEDVKIVKENESMSIVKTKVAKKLKPIVTPKTKR